MSISIYAASIPVFVRQLEALSAILDKAIAFCATKKIDSAVMGATRLIPDMLPLTRQVLIACDGPKNGTSRIAGVEAPKFEDTETTLEQLKERIAKTLAYLATIDAAALDAAAGREIEFPVGPNKMRMEAVNYLNHYVLPNFYFHTVTAYGILRSAGVEVGKRDYLGAVPVLTQA